MGKILIQGREWTIYQKKTNQKHYATKRIDGKLHCVYLGDSPGEAEEKVLAYCQRQGIPEETNTIVSQVRPANIELVNKVSQLEQEIAALKERLAQVESSSRQATNQELVNKVSQTKTNMESDTVSQISQDIENETPPPLIAGTTAALTTEQKMKEILKAVAGGLSGMKIEPSRKGTSVTNLKKGRPVAPATIDRLYARVQELLASDN